MDAGVQTQLNERKPMAVKAFALVQDSSQNGSDNTKVDLNVRVVILGSDTGDVGATDYNFNVAGLAAGDLAGMKSAIKAAVKSSMEGHGITFTPVVDTVDLYD